MENSLPICNFPEYIILEYASGGAEFALALPETVRMYCAAAARLYHAGCERTARDIFIFVLRQAVTGRLGKKLKRFTVPELAGLAAYLLNAKFRQPQAMGVQITPDALEKAIERIRVKS